MGRLCGPPLLSEPHLMSICMYMLIKCVCTVHVRTLLSSWEALMRVSSKLGASISSTPSSRRLSMGKNTLEGRGKGGEGGEGRGGREGRGGEGRGGRILVTAAVTKSSDTILGHTTLPHTPPLPHIPTTHQCTLLPSHVPPPHLPSIHSPPPTNVHYYRPTYPHPPQ